MAKPGTTQASITGGGPSLADRVRDRVAAAAHARERRDGATRPRSRRPKPAAFSSPRPLDGEARALRDVFMDLGRRYRLFRERTRTPVSPAIRCAAEAFRAQPSLTALIPVAGFLDDLALLDW